MDNPRAHNDLECYLTIENKTQEGLIMRKARIPVLLLAVMLIFLTTVVGSDSVHQRQSKADGFSFKPLSLTEKEVLAAAPPLCEDSTQIALEFETLGYSYEFIRRYSIFRAQAENSEHLIRAMTERTFQFLSGATPDWAQDIIDEEVGKK